MRPRTTAPRPPPCGASYRTTVKLPDRTLLFENHVQIRSDRANFYYSSVKRLSKDGVLVREKRFEDTIPRDHQ